MRPESIRHALLGTGVFLTIRLRFVQEVRFREAPRAMAILRPPGTVRENTAPSQR